MSQPSAMPPLYFLHIPRTAGTSLRLWMYELYGTTEWLPKHYLADGLATPVEELAPYRFFSGHFGWDFVQKLDQARGDVRVVTWLRDPVAREISAFRYAAAKREKDWALLHHEGLSDPAKFLRSTFYQRFAANYQTRNLTGLCGRASGADAVARMEKIVSTADLELALQHLQRMAMFGITDDMMRSVALFCEAFQLPFLAPPGKANAAPVSPADGCEAIDESVRTANAVDVELYERAREVFEGRWAELLARYDVPAEADDALSRLRERMCVRCEETPIEGKPDEFEFDVADGLIADGFGQRFYFEPARRWLRWAGACPKASVFLPLGERSEELRLELCYVADERILGDMKFFSGERSLDFDITYEPDEAIRLRRIARVRIPKDLVRPGYTRVDIVAPACESEKDGGVRRSFTLSRGTVTTGGAKQTGRRRAAAYNAIGRAMDYLRGAVRSARGWR